ncbi:hypothetical protein Syun_005966 [Stephania yunnanensis]|uniref:Protein SHORT-ROOT-like n=1 Tax=Stephania yunnanensis TaxID=152371 RepID=A0AAP0PY55_9MAGN
MDATLHTPKLQHLIYCNQTLILGNGEAHITTMPNNNNIIHSNDQSSLTSSTSHSSESNDPFSTGKWASKLLRECAKAIADKDSSKFHHLLWMLNELASPYGDCDQKLASYFLQALFSKATDSGNRCYKTLTSVVERNHCFETARKVILKFQEVSPWTTFGHVASNGAILEALEGETKLHIIDISNTFCTQWPTLLEALATRNDETPHLNLTVVATPAMERSVMKEIGQRMEKFAGLMRVPFEFHLVTGLARLGELTKEELGVREGEAIAVNCIGALRRIDVDKRVDAIRMLCGLKPKVVTIVEEEADFTSSRDDYVKCFEECLRFYTLFFEMLEESFAPTSNERLALERECGRSIVNVLACDNEEGEGEEGEESDRREKGTQWCEKMKESFTPIGYSDDVIDDVKALLKRYRSGWSLLPAQGENNEVGLYLAWKEEPVVWTSAWKP